MSSHFSGLSIKLRLSKHKEKEMADTFPSRWEKLLSKHSDWKDGVESKQNEDLQREILKQQGLLADMEHEKDNDVKLNALKEELKGLNGHYRDIMNEAKAKSAYCLYLLRSRGSQ